MPQTERYSSCACGQVRFKALGAPMFCAVCYCDDCQKGAGPLEALSGAPAFRDADGGTPYLGYRDDRFTCIAGEGLLEDHRIKPNAPTRRVVATCCNAAVFLKFGPGHWVSAYRARFEGEPQPLEMRIQTKFRVSDQALPQDVPSYKGFGPKLFGRLIGSRLSMMFGR